MSGYQKKITRHTKKQNSQCKETEQKPEIDSDMVKKKKLELSNWELNTNIINMLKVLIHNVNVFKNTWEL